MTNIENGGGPPPTHGGTGGQPEVRHSAQGWDDFLYVAGRLLVTESGLEHIMPPLESITRSVEVSEEPLPGTDVFTASFEPGPPGPHDPVLQAFAAMLELDLGEEVAPDFVLTFGSHANYFPAAPAKATTDPRDLGRESDCTPALGVIDVGFNDFGARTGHMDLPTDDPPAPPGPLAAYVGHGESVAWIVSRHIDKAPIIGESVQPIWSASPAKHGVVSSSELTRAINVLLSHSEGISIITLTAGGPVGNGVMLPVRKVIRQAAEQKVLVVSAIGNDAKPHRIYPAAWDEVLAVGARVQDHAGNWDRADFNNTFDGIDVYAPGRHVVPWLHGNYDVDPGRGRNPTFEKFKGRAEILGTSFAVPEAAGAVAALCEKYRPLLKDMTPRQAAKTVLGNANLPGFEIT